MAMKVRRIDPVAFQNVSREFQSYIADNVTGSVLCAVYHQGVLVYCNKFGWKDKDQHMPIAFDDIFRIYSMAKPVTSVAALILYEEGKYELDDPLENYLPEFRNPKVLTSYDAKSGEVQLEDVPNPITIKHLFTHTSGLSYGWYPNFPVDRLIGEEFGFTGEHRIKTVLDMYPVMDPLHQFSQRLAKLPLFFIPGTHWWYGYNHDILGYLIEVLSGTKFDVFLKDRIFDKLEMKDTDFYVPKEKWGRLVKVYTKSPDNKLLEVTGGIADGFNHRIQFLSGGAGLVSTLTDYLKFCIMLLNGGQYNNQQIISKDTIELMTSNQLPNDKSYLEMQYIRYEDSEVIKRNTGYGFGLGVLVKVAQNEAREGIGAYSWGGALNTFFTIDPANQVISLVLTQYCPEDNKWIFPIDHLEVTNMLYRALEKAKQTI